MKKNFILIILLLFIFINKVQAETKTVNFSDFSKNEIMLSEENYLVIGNVDNDFNSIKFFADKYCSNKLGDNHISSLIQISTNVAYSYCLMIDRLDEYNFTDSERSCFSRLERRELTLDFLNDKNCKNINRDFGSILTEINKYKEKINILGSMAFIYEIFNEDLSKKISNFEKKVLLYKKNQELKQELATLENPLKEQIDTLIVNRNIKLCKLYEFVEGSELYFYCILRLIENTKTSGLIDF